MLLLVIWAIRAGSPLTLMTVKGGLLDVRQGGLHLKFDLASPYTPVEVEGTPGQRGWKVLIERHAAAAGHRREHGRPGAFTDVLRRFRPELTQLDAA